MLKLHLFTSLKGVYKTIPSPRLIRGPLLEITRHFSISVSDIFPGITEPDMILEFEYWPETNLFKIRTSELPEFLINSVEDLLGILIEEKILEDPDTAIRAIEDRIIGEIQYQGDKERWAGYETYLGGLDALKYSHEPTSDLTGWCPAVGTYTIEVDKIGKTRFRISADPAFTLITDCSGIIERIIISRLIKTLYVLKRYGFKTTCC